MANKKTTTQTSEKKTRIVFIKTNIGYIAQGYSIIETNGLCKTLGIDITELNEKCKDNRVIIYR